jgi:hypothetical protein
VYFVQTRINGIDVVKIGYYNGRYNPICSLYGRYKLRGILLRSVPGTGEMEQFLHVKFAQLNYPFTYVYQGKTQRAAEFFRLTPALIEFINQFEGGVLLPPT